MLLKDLVKEIEEYHGKGNLFLRDPNLWSQMVQLSRVEAV
jgi:hypothetical protein